MAALRDESDRAEYQYRLKLYESAVPYRDHSIFANLAASLLEQAKFVEAEPVARECLALREKEIPDHWRAFNARSLLGGSLTGQKRYAEAENFLLTGYAGMKQREDQIPANAKFRVKEALQRVIQFYEATGQSDKAAEWKQKLAELDKTQK